MGGSTVYIHSYKMQGGNSAKISVVIHNLQLPRGVTKRRVVDDCGCSVP